MNRIFKKITTRVTATLLMISFSVVCSSLLTGCQPTPTEPVVMGKDSGAMESAIAATAKPITSNEQTKTNQDAEMKDVGTWEDDVSNEKTNINVNAKIRMPSVSAYPIIEVRPNLVDEKLAKKFIDSFQKENMKISNGTVNDELRPQTKEEIEGNIVSIKKHIADVKAGIMDPDEERPADEVIEELESYLKKYEYDYDNFSPDKSSVDDSLSYKFAPQDGDINSNIEVLYFTVEGAKGSSKTLSFTNKNFDVAYSNIAYFNNEDVKSESGKSVSKEQAKQLAFEFIEELDIDSMMLVSEEDVEGRYNYLTFARTFGGVPIYEVNPSAGKSGGVSISEASTSFVIPQESMHIMVNDTGIALFEWNSPYKEFAVQNENVEIKDVDDIKKIFKDQILFNVMEIEGKNIEINISEMRLSYMVMPTKDDLTTYRTVPVWDFLGKEKGLDEEFSYLTINAIDGSVIDRNIGY